jgi:hypothetical protein
MANRLVVIGLLAATCVACSSEKSNPGTPTPGPAPSPTLSVTGVNVTIERVSNGFTYRVVTQMRESGGAAAPVAAIELTFTTGSTTLVTSRQEQVLPNSGNAVPANGTASSREMAVTDAVAGHAPASTVAVRVIYGSNNSVATGSGNVPPLPDPPPPSTLTLTGFITDVDTNAGIEGARVEAINGANAGKATTTNSTGAYSLTGLVAEQFRMRASVGGYDSGEQNVTVPNTTRADMQLRRSASAPCSYTVVPGGPLSVGFVAGSTTLTMTRTSGTCGWQASKDVSWITLGAGAGGGDGSLNVAFQSNASFVGRSGTVTISWTGGSTSVTFNQAAESPAFCRVVAIAVNGQNPVSIGSGASGTITAQITPEPGTPPGACGTWNATGSSGVTFTSATTGPTVPATISFTVSANPSTSTRTLNVVINFVAGNPSAALTINQSGQ